MSAPAAPRANFALGVLCLINLLNYLDRYLLTGVMESVQKQFTLNNAQGGLLATVFLIVYTFASPASGFLGDRVPRRFLIAGSVLIWSAATIGTGLATSFAALLVARAFTGFGEAGYGTVAPSVISDLFRKEHRTRMLAFFYTAMPLGAAAGFKLGEAMAKNASWHYAYFAGGAPGIILGLLALTLPEPKRGATDDEPMKKVAFVSGLLTLLGNGRYWLVVAGLTLMTFSIGGLSIWMVKFLATERGFEGTEASTALGTSTIVGGLIGTLVGGWLGDRMDRRMAGGGVLLSAVGLMAAAPLMVGAAIIPDKTVLFACLLGAQFFIFLNSGPLNAAIVNVVTPDMRAFAFGISMLTLHLLGDAISPTVIGWISDRSSLSMAILFNAAPVALGGLVLLPAVRLFRRERLARSSSAP